MITILTITALIVGLLIGGWAIARAIQWAVENVLKVKL